MSATILIIEDDALMRQSLQQMLILAGFDVLAAGSGREGMAIFESRRCSVVVSDVCLPDANGIDILKQLREADEDVLVIMLTAFPAVQAAVAAMRAGAYDYIVKPFDSEELKCVIDRALATRQLQSEVLRLRHENTRSDTRRLVGNSPVMTRVKDLIARVAPANVPVLILGESGTGKELIADAVHNSSMRRTQAMVKMNCSAIPASRHSVAGSVPAPHVTRAKPLLRRGSFCRAPPILPILGGQRKGTQMTQIEMDPRRSRLRKVQEPRNTRKSRKKEGIEQERLC